MTKSVEFWYDFASTYTYLSAMRIRELSCEREVEIIWRPFLLGPIFQDQGWNDSPFNVYPNKGRYMVRDIERVSARRGLRFQMPDQFPANSVTAARIALVGLKEGWGQLFTIKAFEAAFSDGADIGNTDTLRDVLTLIGLNADHYMERIQDNEVKQALRDQTSWAKSQGIFGAPSFVTEDQELFWGDDRLEDALNWTPDPRSRPRD